MLPNPEMTLRLVRDHQRDLLREAEIERLMVPAHAARPLTAAGLLQSCAAAVAVAGRAVRHLLAPAARPLDTRQPLPSAER